MKPSHNPVTHLTRSNHSTNRATNPVTTPQAEQRNPQRSQYVARVREGLAGRLRKVEADIEAAAAAVGKNVNALRLVSELTGLRQKMARLALFTEASGLCPACYIDREIVAGLKPDPQDDEALRCERCKSVFST
jgi:hypothetical protein